MPRHAAAWLWDGEALRSRCAVLVDRAGVVQEIESLSPNEEATGLLLPGLVNAHAHLELSWLAGAVAGGAGSVAWVGGLGAARARHLEQWTPAERAVQSAANERAAAAAAARSVRHHGAAFLVDVSNAGWTAALLAEAGLRGAVQLERLGVDADRWAAAPAPPQDLPGVRHRTTAHSPISCSPALLRAVLGEGGAEQPAPTVHCEEDPADRLLLADRTGPWVAFHRGIAAHRARHDWEGGLGRGRSGVAVLGAAGVLGPHLGLVHLVAADARDLDQVAASGATAVLCPRSNLHISGCLPDVPGLVERGVPLALGTDSLASSPDLDVLAEAAVLRARFPSVAPSVWLRALTTGGAALLGEPERRHAGQVRPGCRPGLLHMELPLTHTPLHTLLSGPAWPRRWVA